ncbi:DUF1801 domain-containing protein [Pseudoalteromonas luteoviolacea]|uniref:YdhG-like domain-containing protein n=1 Tax=Pseudoalteromonas luteoviolacea S4054 TaxID=1129367 RepID=A0A0F6A9F6_9GAMM|nr:DUF1801 domain-containing protein [Pseudoalteromonas luteoviolacea]AOT08683.1 hypothetical protein S4054249_12835 [Pseudoalteromonas luteoviolacea]AOT13598.1 hypothetical protein S40542_12810 [Pseudoalteromonas luteoviolacea]AOT18511.1 hypothetical protein S4054_12810 [Pseudoalteromonas luteoviolacea]KKE82481.1 hypothetical protein N479_17905 [Pseudoalteromonas luteoviolacea S4054]KZN72018.1 hypothetical protein N481_16540 [Pseudoalteromonas luteoviolacea S4047-1]
MDEVCKVCWGDYPELVRARLEALRGLIFEVARELDLGVVEESIKWGEPSYKVKLGSPIRIDWKPATPKKYCMFFHCQTKLVDTYKALYGEVLQFQGNRAIVLSLSEPLPKVIIKHCLELALTYQQRKHLPLLGA